MGGAWALQFVMISTYRGSEKASSDIAFLSTRSGITYCLTLRSMEKVLFRYYIPIVFPHLNSSSLLVAPRPSSRMLKTFVRKHSLEDCPGFTLEPHCLLDNMGTLSGFRNCKELSHRLMLNLTKNIFPPDPFSLASQISTPPCLPTKMLN